MRTNNPVVIAGAGMTGLIAALLLRHRYPQLPIVIIESSASAGGNYRCINYAEHGAFDQGMRIYYDTGIAEIDDLVESLLPADGWHIMPDNEKDVAGIFWNGHLQTHSPYLDLRTLSAQEQTQCEEELFRAAAYAPLQSPANAQDALIQHFGPTVAQRFDPVLHKLYGIAAKQLSELALRQPAMTRIVLFEEEKMRDILASESLRARIAWPEQLTFPPAVRRFRQRGLYPKTYGMDTVISALCSKLETSGVTFLFQQSIGSLHYQSNQITTLETSGNISISPRHVIWTGGLQPLSHILHKGHTPALSHAVGKAYLVHLRLQQAPDMEKLYHFYCFDEGYHTFRVTNYTAYCPDAYERRGYPVCVELWYHDDNALSTDVVQHTATEELIRMGIIHNRNRIEYCGVTSTANLHSMYTLHGIEYIRNTRDAIHAAGIANLTYAGIFANDNALLLYEVLQDLHMRLDGINV